MRIMKKQTDYIQIKFDLIKAMMNHVPFDGWSIDALEQGAIDIGFEQNETYDTRVKIYKDLSKPDGTIRKIVDISIAKKYGWKSKFSLNDGFDKTYSDYKKKL